jgi:iron complex outermembrane recepter protein
MASFTPRAIVTHPFLGLPSKLIAGVDLNRADYQSDRSQENGFAAIHHYDIVQNSAALYAQETLTIRPDTDLSLGGRSHFNDFSARDSYDSSAPGAAFSSAPGQAAPLDKNESQYALHAGIEHRFNPIWTGFGRVARSFRFPNVDERVGLGRWDASWTFLPTNFDLKTQTSHDAEAGLKFAWGRLSGQSSVYVMDLTNEIHYDPVNGYNYNLDPTRRYGSETSAAYRVNDTVRLKGGLAYTRAVFREGTYNGSDVPLVSRWTGSAGFSWDIWQKWLTLDTTLRYVGKRRMDNDQANVQPMIPARFILDLKVGGEIDQFFWSASIRNAFTDYYYDYAIASTATSGRYNAYPLPGRTYMLRAGLTF